MRDLSLDLTAEASIHAEDHAAAVNGTGIDLAGCEAALILVSVGTTAPGTVAIEESDDDTTYTAVAAADLIEPVAFDSTPAADTEQVLSYVGAKRYLRVTTSAAGDCGAFVIKGHRRHMGGDAA